MVNTEFRSFLFDPVSLFHSVGDRSLFMFNVHTAESVVVISGLLFSAPIRPVIRRTPLFVGRVTAEYANRDSDGRTLSRRFVRARRFFLFIFVPSGPRTGTNFRLLGDVVAKIYRIPVPVRTRRA